MKTTPVQELPYPESTDPVADYPTVAKQMVELLDLVLPPVGSIIEFNGATAPDGWFLCDGADVDAAGYPKLAQVLGAAPGASFKLPDLRNMAHRKMLTMSLVVDVTQAPQNGWSWGSGGLSFPDGFFSEVPVVVLTVENKTIGNVPMTFNTQSLTKTGGNIWCWSLGSGRVHFKIVATELSAQASSYIIRHGETS